MLFTKPAPDIPDIPDFPVIPGILSNLQFFTYYKNNAQ
jgi:hypothetical protein